MATPVTFIPIVYGGRAFTEGSDGVGQSVDPATGAIVAEYARAGQNEVDEAVAAAREKKPALILADIQLDDGSSGIDAVTEILETTDIPVIFVTAFPERLLTGEKTEPTFLVTKPFEPDVLKITIAQALYTRHENDRLRSTG